MDADTVAVYVVDGVVDRIAMPFGEPCRQRNFIPVYCDDRMWQCCNCGNSLDEGEGISWNALPFCNEDCRDEWKGDEA